MEIRRPLRRRHGATAQLAGRDRSRGAGRGAARRRPAGGRPRAGYATADTGIPAARRSDSVNAASSLRWPSRRISATLAAKVGAWGA